MMAAYLRLSYLKHAAFSLPKAQIFAHFFCPLNDANFMLHRWPAATRAFCNIPDGCHSGSSKSRVSVMESQNDKVVENAENARSVLSLLNLKLVGDVRVFPREILDSEVKLFELFEAWMVENDRSYPSVKEKMRRFKGFKEVVFRVQEINTSQNSWWASVNMFSDDLPSDPFVGCRLTEEEAVIKAADYAHLRAVGGEYEA